MDDENDCVLCKVDEQNVDILSIFPTIIVNNLDSTDHFIIDVVDLLEELQQIEDKDQIDNEKLIENVHHLVYFDFKKKTFKDEYNTLYKQLFDNLADIGIHRDEIVYINDKIFTPIPFHWYDDTQRPVDSVAEVDIFFDEYLPYFIFIVEIIGVKVCEFLSIHKQKFEFEVLCYFFCCEDSNFNLCEILRDRDQLTTLRMITKNIPNFKHSDVSTMENKHLLRHHIISCFRYDAYVN